MTSHKQERAALTTSGYLAVVAGLTLSGASAVSHDLYATVFKGGKADSASESAVKTAVAAGRLLAHGDASITVVNKTPFGLEINDIAITKTGATEMVGSQRVVMTAGATYFNAKAVTNPGVTPSRKPQTPSPWDSS